MRTLLFFILYWAMACTACSQRKSPAGGYKPALKTYALPIGQSTVPVRAATYATEAPFLLVHVHSNETTSADVAGELSSRWGVPLIQILNGEERLIRFSHEGQSVRFDPNRIFSETGITKTLHLYGPYSESAFFQVKRFSDSLLAIIKGDKTIVAVHNNTDKNFSILQYKEEGTGEVHINPQKDEDDFFITTDRELFARLKAKNVNVVLENAALLEEDGSLSMYCSREKIRYVNVEAQHGHRAEQAAMLETLYEILK